MPSSADGCQEPVFSTYNLTGGSNDDVNPLPMLSSARLSLLTPEIDGFCFGPKTCGDVEFQFGLG